MWRPGLLDRALPGSSATPDKRAYRQPNKTALTLVMTSSTVTSPFPSQSPQQAETGVALGAAARLNGGVKIEYKSKSATAGTTSVMVASAPESLHRSGSLGRELM